MLDILTSYTFKVVFAGTLQLSISSALVGSLNLLPKNEESVIEPVSPV